MPRSSAIIDWDNFLGQKCSFSLHELACYSSLNLDPLVIEILRVLWSNYTIPHSTRTQLTQYWQTELPKQLTNPDLITILSSLASSPSGVMLLTAIAAFNSYYQHSSLPIILSTQSTISNPPPSLPPLPISKITSLTTLCSSLHLPKPFTDLVRDYASLSNPYPDSSPLISRLNDERGLEHAGPETVIGMFELFSDFCAGKVGQHLTCHYGRDAGFGAAVAEWIFGLAFEITGPDGTRLALREEKVGDSDAKNNEGGEGVLLTLKFQNRGRPVDGPVLVDPPLNVK
jgi:hypothetical protein